MQQKWYPINYENCEYYSYKLILKIEISSNFHTLEKAQPFEIISSKNISNTPFSQDRP